MLANAATQIQIVAPDHIPSICMDRRQHSDDWICLLYRASTNPEHRCNQPGSLHADIRMHARYSCANSPRVALRKAAGRKLDGECDQNDAAVRKTHLSRNPQTLEIVRRVTQSLPRYTISKTRWMIKQHREAISFVNSLAVIAAVIAIVGIIWLGIALNSEHRLGKANGHE